MVFGHGESRRAGRPQYIRAGDNRDVRGTGTIKVPAGAAMSVSTSCRPDNTVNNNVKFKAAWTSYAEAIVIQAA